jgi:hypothetical protein
VFAVAALAGSGALTASIVGKLEAAAALAGNGDLQAAIVAIGHCVAELSGFGTISTAQPYAVGAMSADIRAYGDLTPQGLANAVWGALAEQNNDAGSMGELLNNSGAGANPWTVALEGSFTAADLLRLVASALAGDAVNLDDGVTVLKSLDGTKNRITGTVVSGNRVIIDRDPSE